VLFADVPPYAFVRFPMETVGVTMFGRAARIHRGVFRLGAPLNASLLPFYLRFERGRFGAQLCEPVSLAAADAPQHVAACIERALADNFARSLIAGHPSIYAFSAAR
jgi:lauroyl/myristoyl acyltransferase